ncbi:MAG TPA: hypothetical protein ENN39_07980 [Desulfonatronum sp.]|nr:hypothetical protein [Desulfonatronum sp.]
MPNRKNKADVSASETIAALEAELHDFLRQKAACAERVKQLLFEEDPAQGKIFAKEIFTLQQEKLRLEVEAQVRRNKINRIREVGLS